MQPRTLTLMASVISLLWSSPGLLAQDGWIHLFNGKDLRGWKANVSPEAYSVVDGILVVHDTSPTIRSHLFFVGDGKEQFVRFRNFELRIVSRGGPHSNSGIFFHTACTGYRKDDMILVGFPGLRRLLRICRDLGVRQSQQHSAKDHSQSHSHPLIGYDCKRRARPQPLFIGDRYD